MEKDAAITQASLAFAALASSLPEGWDGAGARWIKLAPLGRVMGRDGRGPYDFGDAAAAQSVVAASKAYLAGIDGMIDYDHAYDLGALKGVGAAPAAGWIKDLKAEPDGVYGLVEWTGRAALAIAAKEYRYISPVFLHDAMGRVSKIIRAALTAHPNFPMPALASAQNPGDDMSLPKEVAAALGLAETADGAQAAAAVTKLKAELAAAQTGL
ncbi:MAG TPA: phage protease, partial [Azospirillaceae bacterium]|nr:phage protease [Azospirillaceae bacterium]